MWGHPGFKWLVCAPDRKGASIEGVPSATTAEKLTYRWACTHGARRSPLTEWGGTRGRCYLSYILQGAFPVGAAAKLNRTLGKRETGGRPYPE